jgi:oxygen-independent coproporphyrinogen III oxidase
MSGIYIHIPFCKKACTYCNFHFSTSMRYKDEMLHSIKKEIDQRHHFLSNKELDSIYFGGGTPSVLSAAEVDGILHQISKYFNYTNQTEISFECNPDDINPAYLKMLFQTGVNRISLGVQSFHEADLQFMNRSHNAAQAEQSIRDIIDSGFENFTVDLIYGTPSTSHAVWKKNIYKLLEFKVPHISAYALTVEEKTALHHRIKTGQLPKLNDVHSAEQFEIIMDILASHGYIHYEISNYALPGKQAIHNSNYWNRKPYLGLGPSAHSFWPNIRSWNVANNQKYMKNVNDGNFENESEQLSPDDIYNETVLTELRTSKGIQFSSIEKMGDTYFQHLSTQSQHPWLQDLIVRNEQSISLTTKGKHYADKISADLFI